MAEKFFAEMVTRTKIDRSASRLEISLCDTAGQSRTVSLSSEALVALATILAQSPAAKALGENLTRIPESYAVGQGCHEPLVMLRFEDEPAYGLSASQATALGEALLEQAEAVAEVKYLLRH